MHNILESNLTQANGRQKKGQNEQSHYVWAILRSGNLILILEAFWRYFSSWLDLEVKSFSASVKVLTLLVNVSCIESNLAAKIAVANWLIKDWGVHGSNFGYSFSPTFHTIYTLQWLLY